MIERESTPGELAELWAERAAIKEYLGNMSREQAERESFSEIYGDLEI